MQLTDLYNRQEVLGYGATSEVLKVSKKNTLETRALKVFSPAISQDAQAVQRLEIESSALEQIQHPNIVKIFDKMKLGSSYILELEYVDGQDLRKWMAGYHLPLLEPHLWILAQVARGLGAAHEKGILHRDLKPENILISNQGHVKVTDFGVAKLSGKTTLTQVGNLIGSIGYVAPETIWGKKATAQSDLFSFGALAYEMITGRAPFDAENVQAVIRKVSQGDYQPIAKAAEGLPEEIAQLIHSCLSVEPSDRPDSIWHVEAVLMSYLSKSQVLPFCQALISSAEPEARLASALEAKHERIVQSLDRQKARLQQEDSKENREKYLNLLSECRRLFPQDPILTEGFGVLSAQNRKQGRRRMERHVAATLVLVFIVGSLLFFGLGQKQAPSEAIAVGSLATTAPVSDPPAVLPSPETGALSADVKSSSAKSIEAKNVVVATPVKKAMGSAQFIVDEDVQIWVAGQKLLPQQLGNYKMKPGIYEIKLEKSGFLPIDSKIVIRDGQKTVINTRGAP
jgi:eukaryotic-like serine/threonine-protein kinase